MEEYNEQVELDTKILAGDIEAYKIVIQELKPFDEFEELMKLRKTKVELLHYAKRIGCSDMIVYTLFDTYDWWKKKGREAAKKDIAMGEKYIDYSHYTKGLKASRENAKRFSEVVHSRYVALFNVACEKGFIDGYTKYSKEHSF